MASESKKILTGLLAESRKVNQKFIKSHFENWYSHEFGYPPEEYNIDYKNHGNGIKEINIYLIHSHESFKNFINIQGDIIFDFWCTAAFYKKGSQFYSVQRKRKEDGVKEENLLDNNGKLVLPTWVNLIGSFENGMAKIKYNEECNIIDEDCDYLLPENVMNILYVYDRGISKFTGFLIQNNKDLCNIFLPDRTFKYDKWYYLIKPGYEPDARFDLIQEKGLFNLGKENGTLLSKVWFDNIEIFRTRDGEKFFRVLLKRKCNVMSYSGKLLFKNWYDLIIVNEYRQERDFDDDIEFGLSNLFNNGYETVNYAYKNGELWLRNENENIILVGRPYKKGFVNAMVNKNGQFYRTFIDRDGNEINYQWDYNISTEENLKLIDKVMPNKQQPEAELVNEARMKEKNIIEEGKRDNQLLRYLQVFNEKSGKELSLGEFKSMMLKKLSFEGGIHNISLQSNYYLVGAVRYYFEGLLTNNKDLSIFTDPNQPDQWNTDVTRKLNAVILILRNGYIDNLGSEWIEPEDFGTMPLNQLFTKYSKEIKKLISPPKKVEKTPEVIKDYEMLTPKGYTYDIIYSFEDSKKYFNDTSPGAWCITYGNNHLSYYTNHGDGHFVIFRKEGYQNVPRVKQPEKWIGDKPQDDYGNSLIAYLQDNNGPGPAEYGYGPLITSRWNHGSNGIHCEADRAYTQEEFQRITGVSNADLKGIYDTWKRNKNKNKSRTKTKVPKLDDDLLRELKYVQMRINGGENPALLVAGYDKSKIWSICSYEFSDASLVNFLMVNKKIIFETAIPDEEIKLYYNQGVISAIELKKNKRYVLVNNRLKSVVQIDDKFFFKAVSRIGKNIYDEYGNVMTDEHNYPIISKDVDANAYIEVKTGNFEIALIEPSSGLPVKLPNGQYWFNYIAGVHVSSARGGAISSDYITKDTIYEIIYDLSSKEKYFLDSRTGKFLDFINNNNNAPASYSLYTDDKFSSEYIPIVVNPKGIDDEFRRTNGQFQFFSGDRCILYKNGKRCSIEFEVDGLKYRIGYPSKPSVDYYVQIKFDQLIKISSNEMVVIIDEYATARCAVVLNLDTSRVIQRHQGGTYWINKSNTNMVFACKNVLVLPIMNRSERQICNTTLTDFYTYYNPASFCAYFYDTLTDSYVKNPYRRPTEYIFPRFDFRRGYDFIPIRIGQWPTTGDYWDESESDKAKKAKKAAVIRAYNPDDKNFYKVTLVRRGYEDVPSLASVDTSVSSNENIQINESDIVRMVKKVINELILKK